MHTVQVEIVLLLDGKQEQEIDASAAAAKMTKTYCTAFYVDPHTAPGVRWLLPHCRHLPGWVCSSCRTQAISARLCCSALICIELQSLLLFSEHTVNL